MNDTSLSWGTAPALDPFETLMWRLDHYPNLRSAVTGVEILDTAPDRVRLRNAHARAVMAVPRLRQRLVDSPLGMPEWCDDPAFSLDTHLEFVKLRKPGSLRQLLDLAQTRAMEAFDRDRPPWSAVVVEGLQGGRAAYVLKLHHALSDGIGIVQLLSALHSRQRAPRGDKAPEESTVSAPLPTPSQILTRQLQRELRKAPARLRGAVSGLRNAWRSNPADGGSRLSRAARYAASLRRVMAPDLVPPSPLLAERNHLWRFEALDVPLAGLKAAAKACDATLNDAFVSALLGGFQRYHQHFGVALDEIPISFPISIRAEGDSAGGNRFAPGQFSGPIGEADPAARMRLIGEQVLRIREEPALAAPLALMPLMARLPTPVVAKAMAAKIATADLQISNVPGIRDKVYMAGAQVTQLYPYAPLPGCPAMIALVSHGATCCVGFNLDSAAVSDPDQLMDFMRESFDEVLGLGSVDL
jgi:WS/DGAT/MGAT family acyltransferase